MTRFDYSCFAQAFQMPKGQIVGAETQVLPDLQAWKAVTRVFLAQHAHDHPAAIGRLANTIVADETPHFLAYQPGTFGCVLDGLGEVTALFTRAIGYLTPRQKATRALAPEFPSPDDIVNALYCDRRWAVTQLKRRGIPYQHLALMAQSPGCLRSFPPPEAIAIPIVDYDLDALISMAESCSI